MKQALIIRIGIVEKKLKNLIIGMVLSSLAFPGILNFRPEIEKLCHSSNSILIKKILLELANRQGSFEKKKKCGKELEFLVNGCESKVPCKKVLSSYTEFTTKESSNLIGE